MSVWQWPVFGTQTSETCHSKNNNTMENESDDDELPSLPELDMMDCVVLIIVLQVLQCELNNLKAQLIILLQQLHKQEIAAGRSRPNIPLRRSFNDIRPMTLLPLPRQNSVKF